MRNRVKMIWEYWSDIYSQVFRCADSENETYFFVAQLESLFSWDKFLRFEINFCWVATIGSNELLSQKKTSVRCSTRSSKSNNIKKRCPINSHNCKPSSDVTMGPNIGTQYIMYPFSVAWRVKVKGYEFEYDRTNHSRFIVWND